MKLNQVTVGATDFEASLEFYRKLGLMLIVHSPPRYARFETPSGETFSIELAEEASGATTVYFEVDDVDAEVERLGLDPVEGPVDRPWLWREAVLLDPSGNRICIYRAGENRRFPPWRVGNGAD